MKKTLMAVGMCLALAFALTACGGQGENSQGGSEETEMQAAGQTASITLEANPSTGYAWEVTQTPANLNDDFADYFTIVDAYEEPEMPEGEEPIVGATGEQVFILCATQPGEVNVTFDYVSPDGSSCAYEFTYRFKINEDLTIEFLGKDACIPHEDGVEVDESTMPDNPDPEIN